MKKTVLLFTLLWSVVQMYAINKDSIGISLALKSPGNEAEVYQMNPSGVQADSGYMEYIAEKNIPVTMKRQITDLKNGCHLKLVITAQEDVYFNCSAAYDTGTGHDGNQFLLPGFWYRKNERSPDNVPSFRLSKDWVVREDRLSSPVAAVWNDEQKKVFVVARTDRHDKHALAAHHYGDVILSGETSLGHVGFKEHKGHSALVFGFPYMETPKSYLKKLRLEAPVRTFQLLKKGQSLTLTWNLYELEAEDYSDCVRTVWEQCYDLYQPKPVVSPYTSDRIKDVLSHFFVESFVEASPVCYYSGVGINIHTCDQTDVAEVGFIGRNLLNAFNALEYADMHELTDMKRNAKSVFDSYLERGITDNGLLKEVIYVNSGREEQVYSIRRQSEGLYALLFYLNYEKKKGTQLKDWEVRVRRMLDNFLTIQNEDGSFPRKFRKDFSLVDATGGSTSSAVLPLVLGYRYFKDNRYLEAARQAMDYIEREIIQKSDYFSSTLDANCEDKEASISASMAAYYLALVTKGKTARHYAALSREAAYFALSWFYTWDVPFAQGQMLGDLGLHSRGWGNVSIENNHIDVFIFDFADMLRWLGEYYEEKRFTDFVEVISSSMSQLLPYEGHYCGVAKTGYYPEVVQHTNWDYGVNGKGFYTTIFAPGWTVASLWELYSPGRVENILLQK